MIFMDRSLRKFKSCKTQTVSVCSGERINHKTLSHLTKTNYLEWRKPGWMREREREGGRGRERKKMKKMKKGREFTTQYTHNIDWIHTDSQNKACGQLPSASPTHWRVHCFTVTRQNKPCGWAGQSDSRRRVISLSSQWFGRGESFLYYELWWLFASKVQVVGVTSLRVFTVNSTTNCDSLLCTTKIPQFITWRAKFGHNNYIYYIYQWFARAKQYFNTQDLITPSAIHNVCQKFRSIKIF